VEAIWDSIAKDKKEDAFTLTEAQIELLEEELITFPKTPDEGSSWEEVKKRILRQP